MTLAAGLAGLTGLPGHAQTTPATSILGQVDSVDAATRTLTVRPANGPAITIALHEKATVVKVAPGEKSLQNAAAIAFADITAGDRVLVSGGVKTESRVEGALRVVVMAKTDLAARNAEEQRAWRERAVVGTVTAVDPANGEFTLKVSAAASAARPGPAGGPAGPAAGPATPPPDTVVIEAKKAILHRYADDSARYDDAKPAEIQDIAVGDQLRLLGTKSADGARISADRIVFGSFKTRALAIEKVDEASGQLMVKDLQSNEKFSISLVKGGLIRKIPAEMAPMLAMMSGGGRPGGFRPGGGAPDGGRGGGRAGAGPEGGGAASAGAPPSGPGGPPRGGRGAMDMVERMPTITLAELKKDDWVGAVVGRIDATGKAIAFNLLAGIEIFASRANRGGGVDVGMPAGLLDGAFEVP